MKLDDEKLKLVSKKFHFARNRYLNGSSKPTMESFNEGFTRGMLELMKILDIDAQILAYEVDEDDSE